MPFLLPSFPPIHLFSDKFILCCTSILFLILPFVWSGESDSILPLIFCIYGQANIYEFPPNFVAGLLVVGSVLHFVYVKWRRRNAERRQAALLNQSQFLDTYALQHMAKKQRKGVDSIVAQTLVTSSRQTRDCKQVLAAIVALTEVMMDAAAKLGKVDKKTCKNLTQTEHHRQQFRESFTVGQEETTVQKPVVHSQKLQREIHSGHGARFAGSRTDTALHTEPETQHYIAPEIAPDMISDELMRNILMHDEHEVTILAADNGDKPNESTNKNDQGDGCKLDEMKYWCDQCTCTGGREDSKTGRGDLLHKHDEYFKKSQPNAYASRAGDADKQAKEDHKSDQDRKFATTIIIPEPMVDETQLPHKSIRHVNNSQPKRNVIQNVQDIETSKLKAEETVVGTSNLIGDELKKLYLIYTTRKSYETKENGSEPLSSIENKPLKNDFLVAKRSTRAKETSQKQQPSNYGDRNLCTKKPRSSIEGSVKQGKKRKQVRYWDENEEDVVQRLQNTSTKSKNTCRPCSKYQRSQHSDSKFGCQLYTRLTEKTDRLIIPDQNYAAPEIEQKRQTTHYSGNKSKNTSNMPTECEKVTGNGLVVQGQLFKIPEVEVSTEKRTDCGSVNCKCGSDICKYESLEIEVSKPGKKEDSTKFEGRHDGHGRLTVKKDGVKCEGKKSIKCSNSYKQKSWRQDCSPTFITVVSDDDSIFEEESISKASCDENMLKLGLIKTNNKMQAIDRENINDASLETHIKQYTEHHESEDDPDRLGKFIYYERTYNTPTPHRYYSKKIGIIMSEIIAKSKTNRSTRSNIEMKKAHPDSSDLQITETKTPTDLQTNYENLFDFGSQESLHTTPKPCETRVNIHMLDTTDIKNLNNVGDLELLNTDEIFNTGMITGSPITGSKNTKQDTSMTQVEWEKRKSLVNCRPTCCETEPEFKTINFNSEIPITKVLKTKNENKVQKPPRSVKFKLAEPDMDKPKPRMVRKWESSLKSDVKTNFLSIAKAANLPLPKLERTVEVKSKPELLMPNRLKTVRRIIRKPLLKTIPELSPQPQRTTTNKVVSQN